MVFDREYSRSIDESKYDSIGKQISNQLKENKKPDGHNTILPFFGYKWGTRMFSSSSARGGGFEITHKGGDTYEVKETPTYTHTSYSYTENYDRPWEEPFDGATELENKFVDLFKKKERSVWDSTYIYKNLEEYHRGAGETKASRFFGRMGSFGCLFFIVYLTFIILYLVGVFNLDWINSWIVDTFNVTEDNYITVASMFSALVTIVWIVALILPIVNWIISSILYRKVRKIPLSQMNEKYIDRLRKRYYGGMVRSYGEEMGAILKEYSILRAKKENKLY